MKRTMTLTVGSTIAWRKTKVKSIRFKILVLCILLKLYTKQVFHYCINIVNTELADFPKGKVISHLTSEFLLRMKQTSFCLKKQSVLFVNWGVIYFTIKDIDKQNNWPTTLMIHWAQRLTAASTKFAVS